MAVYLNACGHGLSDPAVLRRMAAHLAREVEVGEMQAAEEVTDERNAVRETAARLVGGNHEQTGLCSTTGDPWRALTSRIPMVGKRVLVAPHEWGDNIRHLGALGGQVEILPPLNFDAPDLSDWQARIDGDVAAICVPMVTSVTGLRYPVEAIGALERPDDALFIVDTAQALGQVQVNVEKIRCDAMCGTTRKWMRGPQGTGLYWIGERATALTGLTADEAQTNVSLLLAQGVALKLSGSTGNLTSMLREGLRARGVKVLPGSTGAVTIRVQHDRASGLQGALAEAGIVGKWPNPMVDEPASELTLDDGLLFRLSPHVYNTEDEIERAMAVITR